MFLRTLRTFLYFLLPLDAFSIASFIVSLSQNLSHTFFSVFIFMNSYTFIIYVCPCEPFSLIFGNPTNGCLLMSGQPRLAGHSPPLPCLICFTMLVWLLHWVPQGISSILSHVSWNRCSCSHSTARCSHSHNARQHCPRSSYRQSEYHAYYIHPPAFVLLHRSMHSRG